MTARISVEVVGVDPIVREYPKLVQNAVRKRLTTEIRALGLELLRAVKKDHLNGPRPKNLGRVTGTLGRSINLRIEDTPRRVAASVGTNVIYGRAWELGRVKNWQGKVQPARPFLRPALDEMRAKITSNLRAALGRGGWEP